MENIGLEQNQEYNSFSDGLTYLKTYYDPSEACKDEINGWHINTMADILKDNHISGEEVLEIGSGPSLMCSLLAAPYFKNLYLGDFNPSFQKPLEDWYLQREQNFDFSNLIKLISEAHDLKTSALSKIARERFRQTLQLDIHSDDVDLDANVRNKKFDGVITRFCIDSCSFSIGQYNSAIKRASNLLKNGGMFFQMGFFENDQEQYQTGFWELGNRKFVDLIFTKSEIYTSLEEAKLKIVDWRELISTQQKASDFTNSPIYALYAIKQ